MEMNEEEFAKYLQTFVTDVWSLLMKVSLKPGQVSALTCRKGPYSLYQLRGSSKGCSLHL